MTSYSIDNEQNGDCENIRIKYGNFEILDKMKVDNIFEIENNDGEEFNEIIFLVPKIDNKNIEIETNYERLRAIDIRNSKIRVELSGGKYGFLKKVLYKLDDNFTEIVEKIFEDNEESSELLYNQLVFKENGIKYFEAEIDENIKFLDEDNNILNINSIKLDKKNSYQIRFILTIEGILISNNKFHERNVQEILPKIKCISANIFNMNNIHSKKLNNIYFSQKGFLNKNIYIDFTCISDEPQFQFLIDNNDESSDEKDSDSESSHETEGNSESSDETERNSESSDETERNSESSHETEGNSESSHETEGNSESSDETDSDSEFSHETERNKEDVKDESSEEDELYEKDNDSESIEEGNLYSETSDSEPSDKKEDDGEPDEEFYNMIDEIIESDLIVD